MVLTQERANAKLWIVAKLSALALAAIFVVSPASESRADVWTWLTDLVTNRSDSEATLSGDDLPPGAIATKDGERRVLHLGRDILELYPSTAITIEESGPNARIHLISGTVRVIAAKRKKGQALRVHTLMLVATVKGTDFEVSATGKGAAVSVYEGRVAVKATGRVGGIDVTPGKTATVTSAEGTPDLGPTPTGGAAAATKALSRPSKANAASRDDSGDDGDRGFNKDVKATSRSSPANGAGSGSGDDGEGEGGDGEGGEEGEGEGGDGDGEGGDGEGGESGDDGEGGEDGDDDD